MAEPPAPTIRALVEGATFVTDVEWHDEVTSTNRLVDAAGAAGAAEGLVIGADVQTEGRGRHGRSWVAPAGTSLMLSVLLRPRLDRRQWSLLPLMTGTAVLAACRAVVPAIGDRLGLKWPNDLLVDGVKTAGILVESNLDHVVLGIGINTDWRGVDRTDDLVATSLAEAAGCDVDRWMVLPALVRALDTAYRTAQEDPLGIVPRYVPDCVTLGVDVVAHRATPLRGTAVGLTPEGHLRIRDGDGRDHQVTAGDVEHLR